MQNKIRKSDGFTLVELMVALLIISILLGTAGSVYFIAMKVYTQAENISYKEGSITNVETNFQNFLARTTKVELSENPGPVTQKCYSIGFDNGICQEQITSIVYENGLPKYVTNVNTISQISDIKAQAVPKEITTPPDTVYTLNYELVPFNTMSILKGGVVMNNIKKSKTNEPTADLTAAIVSLNGSSVKHFLVLY